MSHDKMLDFVNKVTKMGLQHFDAGGAVNNGAVQLQNAGSTVGTAGAAPGNAATNAIMPVSQSIGTSVGALPGGIVQGIAQDFTAQNQFQAQNAPIQYGTNANQLNQAYAGAQNGLNQQQGITNTLTPGVQAGAQQQAGLAAQLTDEANGIGPNPAQAQYQANIQNAAAQQAGAIASQKGISPALANREIAQQGGAAMQNAAASSAVLGAQQQLAAQNNLQNLSATQVAQGAGAVQGVNNAQQNEQNILQGANTSANNALVSSNNSSNSINASVAGQNAAANNNAIGGLLGGLGSAVSSIFAEGGMVEDAPKAQNFDNGGEVQPDYGMNVVASPAAPQLQAAQTTAPQSLFGQWLNSSQNGGGNSSAGAVVGALPIANTAATIAGSSGKSGGSGGGASGLAGLAALAAAHGGRIEAGKAVPTLVSPGEEVLSPQQAKEVAAGKRGALSGGERVGGKAKIDHDSYSNDTVPKMQKPGGVVIDLDHMKNEKQARDFVMKVIAAHEARKR